MQSGDRKDRPVATLCIFVMDLEVMAKSNKGPNRPFIGYN